MNDIVKAMRVLAEELRKQRQNEFMSVAFVIAGMAQSLESAADRLERESSETDDGV